MTHDGNDKNMTDACYAHMPQAWQGRYAALERELHEIEGEIDTARGAIPFSDSRRIRLAELRRALTEMNNEAGRVRWQRGGVGASADEGDTAMPPSAVPEDERTRLEHILQEADGIIAAWEQTPVAERASPNRLAVVIAEKLTPIFPDDIAAIVRESFAFLAGFPVDSISRPVSKPTLRDAAVAAIRACLVNHVVGSLLLHDMQQPTRAKDEQDEQQKKDGGTEEPKH